MLAAPDLLVAGVQPLIAKPQPHSQPQKAARGAIEPVGETEVVLVGQHVPVVVLAVRRATSLGRPTSSIDGAGGGQDVRLGSHRDRRSPPESERTVAHDELRAACSLRRNKCSNT